MYRPGLGDCFLLTLQSGTATPRHLLIDCGVILGTKDSAEAMTRIVRDIAATTGGRLDVVVATHEHWDHLSGFLQARGLFDRMKIGEVWLAWTEDPADALAERLRHERQQALRALRVAANRLSETDAASADQLREPLAFFGAASGPGTRDALDYLVNHPSRPRVRYHRPGGEPLELPDDGGTRVYVLGPPRDEDLIRRSDPTKSGHEVYDFGAGLALLAAEGLPAENEHSFERAQAFEPRFRVPADRAAGSVWFRDHYFRPADDWRRIDADWLRTAEQLALSLDNHTNNTSLVLAFELEPGGRVLLFPGDAQVGSWLSWDAYQWRCAPRAADPVAAPDLLRRTVLYKTGHHGSHNATLRERGLERMVSPDLVALLPVDGPMAQRKRWNMPFPSLLDRLREVARGRVIRADEDLPDQPDNVSAEEWQRFRARVATSPNGLYYEYTL